MKKRQVSVLIPIRGNKFLALRRSNESSYGGFWNFPGGSVDPGEFTAGAAVREMEEESGLTVEEDNIDYLGRVAVDDKIIYFYATTKAEGDVKINKESSEYVWITIDEISEYKFIPLNKLLVESLEKYINKEN